VYFSNSTLGTAVAWGARLAGAGAAGDRGGVFGASAGLVVCAARGADADNGDRAARTPSVDCPAERVTTNADSRANGYMHARHFDIELSSGNLDRIGQMIGAYASFGTSS
jgi:hypothetical protein